MTPKQLQNKPKVRLVALPYGFTLVLVGAIVGITAIRTNVWPVDAIGDGIRRARVVLHAMPDEVDIAPSDIPSVELRTPEHVTQ